MAAMAVFTYQASGPVGKVVQGTLEAAHAQQALELLQAQDLRVFALQPLESGGGSTSGAVAGAATGAALGGWGAGRSIPSSAVALVLFELATLLDAGVPLADAVNNAAQGRMGSPAGVALAGAYSKLRGGSSIGRGGLAAAALRQ
jgi:general secretion pathway protein F